MKRQIFWHVYHVNFVWHFNFLAVISRRKRMVWHEGHVKHAKIAGTYGTCAYHLADSKEEPTFLTDL